MTSESKDDLQFMPHINKKSKNIKREAKVEDLLMTDAKKRQEKQKQSETEKDKLPEEPKMVGLASKSSTKLLF